VIVVDTSVWIAALRAGESPEAAYLSDLLEGDQVGLAAPVRVEILCGARGADRVRLRRSLTALPTLYPDAPTWSLVDSWIDRAAAAGERFGFADLLIGALAAQAGATVWSLDSDFGRMARVGLVELFRPEA
jgi:predicted nucleic acid-binding protein